MFNDRLRREAERFRTRFYVFCSDSEQSQTEIASKVGIEQPTLSRYLSPQSDNHLPAFLIPHLPQAIAEGLLRYLAGSLGFTLTAFKTPKDFHPNGTDDELLAIDVLQGQFIQLRDRDPIKARKKIAELRELMDRLEVEVIAEERAR